MNEYERNMKAYQRERAIGLPYLDWLFGAEAAVCNHKWRVESHIGPNSGSETFECRICGASHEISWY
jgi:transcription elongation factor Elf1